MGYEYIKRSDLYEEVWRDPMTTVAARYGVSDVGLAKICRKNDIPLPPRGYWAKHAAGRPPPRVPITHDRFSADDQILLRRPEAHELVAKELAAPARHAAVATLREASRPSTFHPMASTALKRLSQTTGWTDQKGLRSAPKEVLHLSVTADAVGRACQLAGVLVHALEAIGGKVEIDGEKGRTTLTLSGATATWEITEHVGRRDHVKTAEEERALEKYRKQGWTSHLGKYPTIPQYDYIPSGKLTLRIGNWPSRTWNDTPRRKLEERVEEIVAETTSLMVGICAKEAEEALARLRRQQAKARYEELSQAKKAERDRFNSLRRDAVSRIRAQQIRGYVNDVRDVAERAGQLTPELIEWIAWALAKADWIDPLIKVSDPILDAPLPDRPLWGW